MAQICVLTALLSQGCSCTKTTTESTIKTQIDPHKNEPFGTIHMEWKVKHEW